jgi:hypothetical protein
MHAMQGDWSKAVSSYRRSLEGFEAVCGKKDKKITEVSRLLKVGRDMFLNFEHLLGVPGSLSVSLSYRSDQCSARQCILSYLYLICSCSHLILTNIYLPNATLRNFIDLFSCVHLSHSIPTSPSKIIFFTQVFTTYTLFSPIHPL